MKKYRAIAIDDDPIFLKIVEKTLETIPSIELIGCFDNPVTGAIQVVNKKPDVLFLDIEMPFIDGFETVELLDKKPKIIVISSYDSTDEKVKEINPHAFLSKPLDRDQLIQALERLED